MYDTFRVSKGCCTELMCFSRTCNSWGKREWVLFSLWNFFFYEQFNRPTWYVLGIHIHIYFFIGKEGKRVKRNFVYYEASEICMGIHLRQRSFYSYYTRHRMKQALSGCKSMYVQYGFFFSFMFCGWKFLLDLTLVENILVVKY